MKPLCFVLMPFGRKLDERGRLIDFDAVYQTVLAPAVVQAGLEPIRADEEQVGGSIHKPMFERLILCDYAIADVTGANPNVYYELGVRHAVRPRSTLIVFAEGSVLPFDIASIRGLPYRLDEAGAPLDAGGQAATIADRLAAARRDHAEDSPLFQLIDGMPRMDIDHAKTDVFRQQVDYSNARKAELAAARREGKAAVLILAASPTLESLDDIEAGVVIDLLLSLRAVKAHAEMIALTERMPPPLKRARMVREQLAFALNREGRRGEAEAILLEVIAEYGPSSETNALLGRVYKDQWDEARERGALAAGGFLKRAIAAYLVGFEADWRDAYPGVNAVTLMEMQTPVDPRQARLLPVVRYAAARRAERGGDYWDHATLLELAVIARDEDAAMEAAETAVAHLAEPWQAESTAANLGHILRRRAERGEAGPDWATSIRAHLVEAAAQGGVRG